MKKPANPKAAATKRAKSLEACYAQCRKLGRAVRFSFVREIMETGKLLKYEAEIVFAKWVVSGKVVQEGESGGVKIFKTIEQ